MVEPNEPAERPTAGPGPGAVLSAVDIHRLDLAARILAHKRSQYEPRALLVEMAAELARSSDEISVLTAIAVLIRISAPQAGATSASLETTAAVWAGRLLRALEDPDDAALVRFWLRGDLGQRVGRAALRRIRRALRRASTGPGESRPVELSSMDGWSELLDALARSLAVERESEVMIDAALDGSDGPALERRVESTRALLAGGQTLVGDTGVGARAAGGGRPGPGEPEHGSSIEPGDRVGRFTVLHHLGSGAMGVVYAAYDPDLDRKIALKVLRARGRGRSDENSARLMREAQAMARLAHPNVVVVHDVGTHGRDVFVAMEFVRGLTLQAWLHAKERSWPEVVEVFRQAGAGLAAAHAAGLVHRDFKPANAILGDDGRVRVLDFGLCASLTARTELAGKSPGEANAASPGRQLVGTPAYMSPEQFRGEPVEPASDQFSFCVALYEALYGQRPFAGDTAQSIALAVTRGEIRNPPVGGQIPAWLHAITLQGLRADPRARFSSMDELLRALDRSRVRGRRTVGLATAAAMFAGAIGYLSAGSAAPPDDTCSGGAREIASIWNEDRRDEVERRFMALGPDYSAELWPPIAATLDAYAGQWSAAHQEACRSHRRGEQSESLLDRRMVCLAQRKAALAEAAAILTVADAPTARRGLEIAKGLSSIERCGDLERLMQESPLPEDPLARAEIAALRASLEQVRTLERAGHVAAAVDAADAVVAAAEANGYRPTLAEALLTRAHLTIHMNGDWREDDASLTRAFLTALGAGVDETAVEALTLRMYRRSREAGRSEAALDDFAVARELLVRSPSSSRLRGHLLNSAGVALLAIGDLPQAEQVLREALSVQLAALGPRHIEVGYTLSNLAKVAPTQEERETRMLQALAIFEAELGEAHPQSAEIRIAATSVITDPRTAVELLRKGCSALDRLAVDQVSQRAQCLAHLAGLYDECGEPSAAREARERAARLARQIPPDDATLGAPEIALILGYAALGDGRLDEAQAGLRRELKALESTTEWWQQLLRAELQLCLGLGLAAEGRGPEAVEAVAAAVGGYEQLVDAGTVRDVSLPRGLGRARVELASLLMRSGDAGERRRARAELEAAERWYRGAGAAFVWRIDQITLLRAHIPVEP